MEALGINPVLLMAQVISFGILFWVLKKFLYKNIQNALDERRKAIEQTFSDREELEKRLADFEKEQEKKRIKNQEEMRVIIAEARKEAQKQKEVILEQARQEKEIEVEKVGKRLEQDVAKAKKELIGYVKDLSREIVDKALAEKATDKKWQEQQLEKSIKELKNASG